jgi:photosystem II stability/assembly factor-like uncharacterized protein
MFIKNESYMKAFNMLIIVFTMMCFSSPLFAQWVIQHSGLPASQNPTLAFSAVDSNVCWGFQPWINNPKCVLTTDGGDHWSQVPLPAISGVTIQSFYALDRNTAWAVLDDAAGTSNGGIFKTSNGGNDWIKQGTAFPGAGGHPSEIYFFDANSGLCVGEPRNGYWEIYTTADGGTNWIRVPSANIPAPAAEDFTGDGIARTGAGNCFWFNSASCSVYRTTDKGLTWSVSRSIFPAPAFFTELAFRDTLNGLACSYFGDEMNKVSRTTNGGVSWTRLPAPPSPPSSYWITYVPGTSWSYFVTSHKNTGYPVPTIPGSMYTPDDGHTWIQVDSVPHGPASFISNKTGWSAGCGDTIFKWNGYPLGIATDYAHNNLINTVTLSQNYPNPFTSSTSIQFQIPISSKVILKVYDIQGLEVETLVNEEKPAGSYNVNFESGGLSSGIYYYCLKVGEAVQTKTLCIL